jgi:hypothetical protein
MLQAIEMAAVDSADGHPHDDIALLGLRLAETGRGVESGGR